MKAIDLFAEKEDGSLRLENAVFNRKRFLDFSLRGAGSKEFKLVNVSFEDCLVDPGVFSIAPGVSMEKVNFENFECGDAMHIAAEVCMNDVVIRGKNLPKMLWIKPSICVAGGAVCFPASIDISEYRGELSVTGLDVTGIKFNPVEHVPMKLEKMMTVDWQALGISMLSYWRILAKKIRADGATSGLFSLPPVSGKNYQKSMMELGILRSQGVL